YLSKKILKNSIVGSILSTILHHYNVDKFISEYFSELVSLNVQTCYWLLYLFEMLILLCMNFAVTLSFTRHAHSKDSDWCRTKKHIFKARWIYNFTTKKEELLELPMYAFVFFILLLFFGTVISIDTLILTPTSNLFLGKEADYTFQYSSGIFYGIFNLSFIPPYLYLLFRIFTSQFTGSIK
ncbi:MAG: hypothetical protein KAR12_07190, partial [Methylococcales bacterium]|nr:hypothetical protein [Methylococcales bacterium]